MPAYSVPEEAIRIVAMRYVLRPAAFLPRRLGVFLARFCALPLFLLPSVGLLRYYQTREVFGLNRPSAFRLAWKRLSIDFVNFLYSWRILKGRDDPERWPVIHKNREGLDAIVREGGSFIVATSHFTRQALFPTRYPDVMSANQVHISLPYPEIDYSFRGFIADVKTRSLGEALHDSRVYLQYRTFHDAGQFMGVGRVEYCFLDKGISTMKTINSRLKEPGNAIVIHIDAPWTKKGPGSIERPFAGIKNRLFATGAAKLSQISGRPIVSLTYWYDEDRHVYVYEWGDPIQGGQPETVMNRLVDLMETTIGERPEQYQLNIGTERHWDARTKKWIDP